MITATLALAALLAVGLSPVAAASGEHGAEFLPDEPVHGSGFGQSIACSGTLAVVGAPLVHGIVASCPGAAYTFDLSTGTQLAQLVPGDDLQDRLLGWSVAIDGTTAVVGAMADDEQGYGAGAAYLFDATTGTQLAKLLPTDGETDDYFGWAVAIRGTTVAVSAVFDDDNGASSGSVYLFDALTGVQVDKLLASDGEANDQFGRSVAIDGTTLIVGASEDADNGPRAGSAYLFDVASGRQLAKLLASDGVASDRFGQSVGISGSTAIVGAPDSDPNGASSGAAYLFDAVTGEQLAKLVPNQGGAGDLFGSATAMCGTTAVVGARSADVGGQDFGAAYLFDATTEQQIATLLADDGRAMDRFGASVAIDGRRALVGAPLGGVPGLRSGSAYAFATDQAIALPYCFGSGGTVCPCDNAGASGRGCANASFAAGARLWASGSPRVASDDLALHVEAATPLQPALFIEGAQRTNGGAGLPFGDGLRCVGGGVRRLQSVWADETGSASSTVPLAQGSGIGAGDVVRYQCWYRDGAGSPCGSGFNLTNGLEAIWAP